ncbi:MAG TPA: saccharopine dehydrogenase NADP-binding domain-containing protein [Burkholderiaceae bacterium]|nr:saccharopine dehydrogenase NADP-binding domain-containing protein [Burkholderiaceae bacterium]
MQTLLKRKIVVLAGFGEFSRRVASGIAALPQAECVLGLPPGAPATAFASRVGVPFMVLDPNDPSSLQRLLEGAFAVVNVRGPFKAREHLAVAARCAALGVHYVDPAESREYIGEFEQLARAAREHDALLVTGAGAAPAVTAALCGLLAPHFDRVNEIHIFLTPGIGDQRELATTRTVLERAEQPPRVKQSARRREEQWWEQPQTVGFPAPVGRRRGYLCDLPDLELFTKQFGARTVSARTGFAPGLLNLMLAVLALLRRRGLIKRLSPLTGLLMRAAASKQVDAAAIRIAMRGSVRGADEEHIVYLVGRNGAGPAIAAAPIVTLVRKWLEYGTGEYGALACVGLLDFDALKPALAGNDVVLVRE